MTIRIATFNAENLFRRPKALGIPDVERRRRILADFAELVSLLDLARYERDEKLRIAELVRKHRAYATDAKNPRRSSSTSRVAAPNSSRHPVSRTAPSSRSGSSPTAVETGRVGPNSCGRTWAGTP